MVLLRHQREYVNFLIPTAFHGGFGQAVSHGLHKGSLP